ncbi:MAG: N-acetylmuramoyl-L-alanine amidase [Burkholderiales bacterium]|nr:N-acetylmuramoyl-L-alanine amidase [Burkholderiales bacterium]
MTLDLRIRDHQFEPGERITVARSPNVGGEIAPSCLVLHYTAGRSLDSSVAHFMRPAAQASAHLVVGRDGRVVQLVPFNRSAWHAGRSTWKGLQGLNQHSIGIELDNAGRLVRSGAGYRAWFQEVYPAADVVTARHRNEQADACWHAFTDVQVETALDIAVALVRAYPLGEILGHDDIAPGRKCDPGPAFPMESFRAAVFGRRDDAPQRHVVTATLLNLRAGPGRQHAVLARLAQGLQVDLLEVQDGWGRVTLGGLTSGGWVSLDYIRAIE